MSQVEGKFKAKFMYAETSKEGQAKFLRMVMLLEEEWVDDRWEVLGDVEDKVLSKTYWLKKEVKEGSKMSSYEYSVGRFKKDWRIDMKDCSSTAVIKEKLGDVVKEVILEADESNFHNIKWINSLGGRVREGQVDLQDLL